MISCYCFRPSPRSRKLVLVGTRSVAVAVSSRLRSVGWMLLPPERPGDSLCCMKEWDKGSKNAQRSNAAVQFSAQNFQWGLRPVDEKQRKKRYGEAQTPEELFDDAVESVLILRGHLVTVSCQVAALCRILELLSVKTQPPSQHHARSIIWQMTCTCRRSLQRRAY